MAYVKQSPVVNIVLEKGKHLQQFLLASSNRKKLEEFRAMGLVVLPGEGVEEIQNKDPFVVITEKAKQAYLKNGYMPTLVEDTSFEIDAQNGLPGVFVKFFLGEREQRELLCASLPKDNRGVTFRVLLGIFDGYDVHIEEGVTRGVIAKKPMGPATFAFDDIFIPEKATQTYAEMSFDQKNKTSPRKKAVDALLKKRIVVGERVYQLSEPAEARGGIILKDRLTQDKQAVIFAFALDSLSHVQPNNEFHIGEYAPVYKEAFAEGKVVRYIVGDPKNPSQGLILVPSIDLKTVPSIGEGEHATTIPIRLSVVGNNPILLQMGPKAIELALASRAREYVLMHNAALHEKVRGLLKHGKKGRALRSQNRSLVLEKILDMQVQTTKGKHSIVKKAQRIVAPSELGYIRESSQRKVSRKKAAKEGLLSVQAGLPTMPIALGGMPPTTGSVDALVTAAMSYMRSWIPHNGIFAGDFERQLRLFTEAKKRIRSFHLPEDIAQIVLHHIGLSVGGEDLQILSQQAKRFQDAGGYAIRIYTTNPGLGVEEAALTIRHAVGKHFVICVGPITDVEQARRLIKKADVNMFIVGHGGGENCTSLEGGGAANAIALLYEMNLDTRFQDRIIGIEGGVGTGYGPLLSLVDFFSLNGKVVGGIEPTGGLFVKHKSGLPVLPYHGSASVVTQKIEAFTHEDIRKKRLGDDGMVENVEGKPNYKPKKDWANSMVNYFQQTRAYLGLVLADMDAMDIFELRKHVAQKDRNIVGVSSDAHKIAFDHRNLQ